MPSARRSGAPSPGCPPSQTPDPCQRYGSSEPPVRQNAPPPLPDRPRKRFAASARPDSGERRGRIEYQWREGGPLQGLRQPPRWGFSHLARQSRGPGLRTAEQGEQTVPFLVERLPVAGDDRCSVAELDPAGVFCYAVHAELVMQVGSGCQSSGAHITDDLALLNSDTTTNVSCKPAEMAVTGGDPVEVAELDQISITSRPSRTEHDTIARGHDRRAGTSGIIGALVPAGSAQHGMKPGSGEPGGDPAELHGSPEEGPAQRISIAIVVQRGPSLAAAKAECRQALPGNREIGCEYPPQPNLPIL